MLATPALFLLLGVSDPAHLVGRESAIRAFQIAPQPLDAALERLAMQANIQVLYDRPPDPGLRSPGFTGTASIEEALRSVLRGTGLRAHVQGTGDVILESAQALRHEPIPDTASRAPARLRLDALRVEPILLGESEGDHDVGMDIGWYIQLVETEVRRSLKANPAATGRYRVTVDVWIDPAGFIRRAHIATSSGSSAADQTISATLEAMRLEAPPPADLRQPMRLSIRAQDP